MYTSKTVVKLTDKNDQTTLKLDGKHGNIIAGGKGHDGDLILKNQSNELTIHLDASRANIVAGGHGQDGDIILLDEEAIARVIVEAYESNIEFRNSLKQTTLTVDGVKSDVWVQANDRLPKDSPLLSIKDVAVFWDQEKSLPGMPSPEEMTEKGVFLKEFMFKLLKQVENLTQYIIAQEERINALEK